MPGRARVYCVMEMLEGQSLTELLATERPAPGPGGAASSGRSVDALQAAHDVGRRPPRRQAGQPLRHRARRARDFVKVLDFGVAKLVAPLGDVPMTTTVEGTIVGTPAYMAPEQATGGNADARTDLYSVGVVLYELLAGHPPFQAPAFGQLVAQVLSSPPPPLPACARNGERIPGALGRGGAALPGEEPGRPVPVAARSVPGARGRGPGPGTARSSAVGGGRRSAGGASLLGVAAVSTRVSRRPRRCRRSVVTGKLRGRGRDADAAGAPARDECPRSRAGRAGGPRVRGDGGVRSPRVHGWWRRRPDGRWGRRPLNASFTRSSVPTRLRLERTGRRPAEVEVVPESPREIHVSLPRAPGPPAPRRGRWPRARSRSTPTRSSCKILGARRAGAPGNADVSDALGPEETRGTVEAVTVGHSRPACATSGAPGVHGPRRGRACGFAKPVGGTDSDDCPGRVAGAHRFLRPKLFRGRGWRNRSNSAERVGTVPRNRFAKPFRTALEPRRPPG